MVCGGCTTERRIRPLDLQTSTSLLSGSSQDLLSASILIHGILGQLAKSIFMKCSNKNDAEVFSAAACPVWHQIGGWSFRRGCSNGRPATSWRIVDAPHVDHRRGLVPWRSCLFFFFFFYFFFPAGHGLPHRNSGDGAQHWALNDTKSESWPCRGKPHDATQFDLFSRPKRRRDDADAPMGRRCLPRRVDQ